MAYDRSRLSYQTDFQDVQERVTARKAARARVREAQCAAENARPWSRGAAPRANGGGAGSRAQSHRASRAAASSAVRDQGGMPPALFSYEEAHGPNPLLIALGVVAALVVAFFLVTHVRSCLDEHRMAEYSPTAQPSSEAQVSTHGGGGAAAPTA